MGTEQLLVKGHPAGQGQLGLPAPAHLDPNPAFTALTLGCFTRNPSWDPNGSRASDSPFIDLSLIRSTVPLCERTETGQIFTIPRRKQQHTGLAAEPAPCRNEGQAVATPTEGQNQVLAIAERSGSLALGKEVLREIWGLGSEHPLFPTPHPKGHQ